MSVKAVSIDTTPKSDPDPISEIQMHIPSVLFSILIASMALALPTKMSNRERLFPRLVLQKLDTNADEDSLQFQPALDFNRNS